MIDRKIYIKWYILIKTCSEKWPHLNKVCFCICVFISLLSYLFIKTSRMHSKHNKHSGQKCPAGVKLCFQTSEMWGQKIRNVHNVHWNWNFQFFNVALRLYILFFAASVMDSTCIVMAALGRPLYPGMLYDCRRDSFIPGTIYTII